MLQQQKETQNTRIKKQVVCDHPIKEAIWKAATLFQLEKGKGLFVT